MNKVGTALFPPEPTEEHSLTIAQSFLFLRRLPEASISCSAVVRKSAQNGSIGGGRWWKLAEGAARAFIRPKRKLCYSPELRGDSCSVNVGAQAQALRLRMYVLCPECAHLIYLAEGNRPQLDVEGPDLIRHASEEHVFWLECSEPYVLPSHAPSPHESRFSLVGKGFPTNVFHFTRGNAP
jgi:hypothetical protein